MTPDPTVSQVAAQEQQNPEFAECGVCHGYYSRCVMPCPYSGAPTQEPAGEPAELAEFRAWKADRDEQARTRGRYCLTPEGRAEVRRIFDADDWVFVLLDEVERLEAAIDAAASPQPTTSAQEPLTNIACDVIDGYKAGLAGEPMGMVSAAFDCGWISGDTERRAALDAADAVKPVAFADRANLDYADPSVPIVAWREQGASNGRVFDVPLYAAPPNAAAQEPKP